SVCHNSCAPTCAGQPPTRPLGARPAGSSHAGHGPVPPTEIERIAVGGIRSSCAPAGKKPFTAPMRTQSHAMTLTQKLLAAQESGIRHFYDANQTILHTRFYRDLVRPNDVVLGADSHTSSHGGLGAVSIGLGGADIVVAMVLGTSWIEVPEAISVEYSGKLPFGFGGKEVILRTLALLGRNTVAMERSVEYR